MTTAEDSFTADIAAFRAARRKVVESLAELTTAARHTEQSLLFDAVIDQFLEQLDDAMRSGVRFVRVVPVRPAP